MSTSILPSSQITPLQLHFSKRFNHNPRQPLRITLITRSSGNTSGTNTTTGGGEDDDNTNPLPQPVSPPTTKPAPERLEIRYRRGAKSRQRRLQREAAGELPKREVAVAPKKWEEMTMGEKAMELYVGEKGVLFWLNKFAYASIFIVIGGWILFRFVGPSLNLYQLDSPPLSPTNMFKAP